MEWLVLGPVLWVGLAALAAVVAAQKGRSAGGFFLLALLLSPLVGLVAALVVSPNTAALEAARIAAGEQRQCPYCAELVRAEAVRCKHCGQALGAPERAITAADLDALLAQRARPLPPKVVHDATPRP